jgi:hypothetical protein
VVGRGELDGARDQRREARADGDAAHDDPDENDEQ